MRRYELRKEDKDTKTTESTDISINRNSYYRFRENKINHVKHETGKELHLCQQCYLSILSNAYRNFV